MAYKGKIKDGFLLQRIRPEITSVIAHAASLVLTGVPPAVCECVLTEMYSSVKKSISSIMH
jgi:hypothetical protein